MTANVRCDGRASQRDKWNTIVQAPCGWTGQRYGYLKPGRNDRWADPTLVPCPRCGGRVALIKVKR